MRSHRHRFVAAAVAALVAAPAGAQSLAGKKVLFVNSYHQGYEWSDDEEAGARSVLQGTGAELRFVRMDTKRHQNDAFRKKAGVEVRAEIEAWKPDVVIAADDPAVQFVLEPYYRNASLPWVFCGVNWDASKYGLPYRNATGMLEVALVKELIGNLETYAKGRRVGFLTVDSETERIEGPYYKRQLGLKFASERYVKTLAEWKAAFAQMQDQVDVLLLGNFAGINDWNEKDAAAFALEHTRIPSGAMYDFMMPYAMIGLVKVAQEQGIWAAKTARAILQGAAPASIPITQNRQGKTLLNARLAAKAGVVFAPALLRNAEVVK